MYESIHMKGRYNVKKKFLCLGLVLTLMLTGCGSVATLQNGEEVVATMDGNTITAEDLYEELKNQGGAVTLISMIDAYIVNNEIETDDEAEAYAESQINSYRESYESYGQDFDAALVSAGYADEDEFKEELILEYKKNLVTEEYVAENLTDDEIEEYYDENIYGDINAKHILISPNTDDDMTDEEQEEAEEEALALAEEIIEKLNDGEDFAELAEEYSDDEGTASDGGELTVTYGEVVDEFWDAVSALEDGEYTDEPVESEYGYHIIYRISQEEKPELDDVYDDIVEVLVEEKMSEDSTLQTQALVALRKEYNLEIEDDELNSSYNSTVNAALSSSS